MTTNELPPLTYFLFFFFNDTATTEIYTLSLHDALPICRDRGRRRRAAGRRDHPAGAGLHAGPARRVRRLPRDRKSTRLNSSHSQISYAVFCLKKKNNITTPQPIRPLYTHSALDAISQNS